MKYQSKKDENVTATLISENEKYKTATLKYDSGDDEGKTFDVSQSTLKRWWKKMNDDNVTENVENIVPANDMLDGNVEHITPIEATNGIDIDMDVVNQPYAPNVTPHYIPKPDSVIEYEENKKKRRGSYNEDVPTFDVIVESFGSILVKVNETSKYVKFKDGKGTTLWRKNSYIDIYATQEVFELLTNVGFVSEVNKDKDRPYHIRITTHDEWEKMSKVIIEHFNNTNEEENN